MKLVVQILLLAVMTGLGSENNSLAAELPKYTGHVNDFANVLDGKTREQLENILTNFEVRTGAQIAVATITTLGDQPLEDYANALYRAWGIGAKTGENKSKGALLLVVVEDRKSRLEVGYGLEGDLPDGLAGEMLRRMRPFFREQRWAEGLTLGVRTLVDTLAQKWNISVEGIDQRYAYSGAEGAESSSPLGLLFGLVILVIVLMIIARRSGRGGGGGPGAAAWLGPLIFNRGGGSFGGGSWGGGGGGGGGGWGGFGGGSSGGGGASDGW